MKYSKVLRRDLQLIMMQQHMKCETVSESIKSHIEDNNDIDKGTLKELEKTAGFLDLLGLYVKEIESELLKYQTEEFFENFFERDSKLNSSDSNFRNDDMTLEELNLSIRSHNALKKAGYHHVETILKAYNLGKLKLVKNFGKKSLLEVKNKLKNEGFIEVDSN